MTKNMEIPVWRRYTLTIEEAAGYYHIGEGKLRMLIDGRKAFVRRASIDRVEEPFRRRGPGTHLLPEAKKLRQKNCLRAVPGVILSQPTIMVFH